MSIEIVKPDPVQSVPILPFGAQIRFLLPVPYLLPTGNKNKIMFNRKTSRRWIMKSDIAETFKAHVSAGLLRAIGEMKQRQPELKAIKFPICGSESPLRIDVAFAFCTENRGFQRMLRSDEDNLKKGVYDAIKGIIIDDDCWIVEGFWAKGHAPKEAVEDAVLLQISRAGFREWQHLEPIAHMAIITPWRPEDFSKILTPPSGRIILPGQNGGIPRKSN